MLTRHEIILDMEDPVPDVRKGVKFSSSIFHSTEVTLDVVRWMDMGHPRQIKVTVEPVAHGERPTFNPEARG